MDDDGLTMWSLGIARWMVALVVVAAAALALPATSAAEVSTVFPASSGPRATFDDAALTVGVVVRPNVDGQVRAVRFWKVAGDTGTHIGAVWPIGGGAPLATVTFMGESASGWQTAQLASPVDLTAGTAYVVGVHTSDGKYGATPTPLGLTTGYAFDPAIEAVAPGETPLNGNGVFAMGGAPTFPTTDFGHANYFVDVEFEHDPVVLPPRPGVHGDVDAAQVLVATDPVDHRSEYLTDILLAEGVPQHAWTDAGNVDAAADLEPFQTVVWSGAQVTPAQAALLTDWVQAGGTLVAVHPDGDLDALLGVTRTGSEQEEGYLDVDTTSQPGTGIATETMQYHGGALQLTPLTGTRTVAQLYADRTTATAYAAVTARQVGKGSAVAFAYDLPASIIATRQGNLAWEGQNRDAAGGPQRSSDFFAGDSEAWTGTPALDPQRDWVDFQRIQIPQADEQQRLFAKLLTYRASGEPAATPIPKLWYLPEQRRAALVMTGDGHDSRGVAERVERMDDMSPTGCSVPDWECRRGTFYVFGGLSTAPTPVIDQISDAQAADFVARGYEWGLHHNTNCQDRSRDAFENDATWGLVPQLAAFAAEYPSAPAQTTMRTHCVHEVGWVDTQSIGRAHGIRLNLDSYFWPPGWVGNRPGLMTGSGFPMKLTDRDGSRIDVWSANTQITDESGQALAMTTRTLLDNATDPDKQYFGAFVANMHVDSGTESTGQTVLNAAVGRGVAVISAAQLLEWSDARAATKLEDVTWDGTALGFGVDTSARNLTVLVPAVVDGKRLAGVKRCNGSVVTAPTSTIKGVEQAFVPVVTGRYALAYGTLTYDEQFACTGIKAPVVVPPPVTGGGGGDDDGTGSGGGETTAGGGGGGGGTTGGTTLDGGGTTTPVKPIRFTSTTELQLLPGSRAATCGRTLKAPCSMSAAAPGVRGVVRPAPATRPASQRATILVDRSVGSSRWKRVSTRKVAIVDGAVTWKWQPTKLRTPGLYRISVSFPAAPSVAPGTSPARYARIVPTLLKTRTVTKLLPGLGAARCGLALARPCVMPTTADGMRSVVTPLPKVRRPAGQRAKGYVERRLTDGRWKRVSTTLLPIVGGSSTVDFDPGVVGKAGLYRVTVWFPAIGRVPAGTSQARYARVYEEE